MTSASHAEGRQFDPGQVYIAHTYEVACEHLRLAFVYKQLFGTGTWHHQAKS